MTLSKDFHCAFCNKNQKQVKKLIAGPNIYICAECIEKCHDLLIKSDTTKEEDSESVSIDISPRVIKEFLDEYVIGQDKAKKTLANAAYNHYKRIKNPVIDGVEIDKGNLLLTGPSASGKCVTGDTRIKIRCTKELYDLLKENK